MKLDLADALVVSGLLLVGAGLWLFSPALSLTAVGGILLALGLAASR